MRSKGDSPVGDTDSYDIHLIGTGVNVEKHLTPEAIEALQSCRRVYHLTAFHNELQRHCQHLVDWRDFYQSGSDKVYEEMAAVLLREARAKAPVGFAVYGHPLVLVDTSRLVIERAIELCLTVNVVPGVSSLDVLLQHLLLEVGLSGLQVYEANQLLARRIPLNPDVACLIMQIGAFGSLNRTAARRNHPHRFVALRDYLLTTYGPQHPAVLITCPYLPSMNLVRHTVPMGELDECYDFIHTGMTLYIPPTPPRQIDAAFIAQLATNDAVFLER
jgi:uncharacterized protein YabN with tetrapyrrole methylase and pyrophosphatase domain